MIIYKSDKSKFFIIGFLFKVYCYNYPLFIKEIIYRFGIPSNIITDNGTQFTVREFKDFCVGLPGAMNRV